MRLTIHSTVHWVLENSFLLFDDIYKGGPIFCDCSKSLVFLCVYTIDKRHLLCTTCLILILTDDVLHCTFYTGISLETALLKTGTTVLCWKQSPSELSLALIRSQSSKPRHACQSCTQTHSHTQLKVCITFFFNFSDDIEVCLLIPEVDLPLSYLYRVLRGSLDEALQMQFQSIPGNFYQTWFFCSFV